ncbi:hypothetical protein [Caballeronia sp. LZ001]|uniref:hypothetical protein n=1 Tax=Caballeronia sp. LZ001 TaxID=3038553 RepID=UPI0028605F56|nr:hypothetical protein [Caballeronia sp. LZ001]MDR5806654.1 hypothetical protein [Caballeronia sp. LZ001]
MARKLPRFEPVGIREGRTFWRKYRGNADVERMLLEIAQAREVMQQIGDYFDCLHKVWVEENLGQLVALEKIRLLLNEQALRQRVLAGLKPPPRRGEPDDPNGPDEPETEVIG